METIGKNARHYSPIAKLWNQHRCQSRDEWKKENVVYIHNEVLFTHKEL
jgi:hypothetical protein